MEPPLPDREEALMEAPEEEPEMEMVLAKMETEPAVVEIEEVEIE